MKSIMNCLIQDCSGKLEIASQETLQQLRKAPPATKMKEGQPLRCSLCKASYSATTCIESALERGFQRCFSREKLTCDEISDLIWEGLPLRPPKGNIEFEDHWLLLVSSVQVAFNLHDWKHRKSCFKNGRLVCRYNIPHTPSEKTCILPVYATANNEGSNKEILRLSQRCN